MPTINIRQEVYDKLLALMEKELKKKLNKSTSKETLLILSKSKYGITFSYIIEMLLKKW